MRVLEDLDEIYDDIAYETLIAGWQEGSRYHMMFDNGITVIIDFEMMRAAATWERP